MLEEARKTGEKESSREPHRFLPSLDYCCAPFIPIFPRLVIATSQRVHDSLVFYVSTCCALSRIVPIPHRSTARPANVVDVWPTRRCLSTSPRRCTMNVILKSENMMKQFLCNIAQRVHLFPNDRTTAAASETTELRWNSSNSIFD